MVSGQWIGTYAGTSNGTIVINIDALSHGFQGVAYLHDNNKQLPSSMAYFNIDSASSFKTRAHLLAIHPETQDPASWEQVKRFYPGDITFSNWADVDGQIDNDYL